MAHNANTMRQIRRHGLSVYRDGRSAAAMERIAALGAVGMIALARRGLPGHRMETARRWAERGRVHHDAWLLWSDGGMP